MKMLNLWTCIGVFLKIIIITYSLSDQHIMDQSNHYPTRTNNVNNSAFINYTIALRSIINQQYKSLIENIKQREMQVLQELDSFDQEYRNLYQKYNTTLDNLENSKQFIIYNLCSPILKEYCEKIVKATNEKIRSIELKIIDRTNVTLEWNEILASKISQIGQLARPGTSECLNVNYQSKVIPIIEAGIQGNGVWQLDTPYGVTTDKNTKYIYVVDHVVHRVSVFNSTGNFQFNFKGIMNKPVGIAMYEDKVYVSQLASHSIHVYSLDGTFLHQFGSYGTGKGQLYHPYGLDVNPFNGDIYVADFVNKRVQIFDKYFNHKSYIINQLIYPIDVKLTRNEIFVLDHGTQSVKVYDYNNNYLRSVINSTGDGYQLKSAENMFIDANNNILLSDVGSNNVLIFNHLGDFINQLGTNSNMFLNPRGMTVDKSCRLIVVNRKQNAVIQIF